MAYRVSDVAHQARVRPAPGYGSRARSHTLNRNVLIAGLSLGALTLASAGGLLIGNNEFAAVSNADRRAIKIALVDATAPEVVKRDPRVALAPPEGVTIVAKSAPAPAEIAALVPLPPARPAQHVIEAALTPLPRERIVLASADPESTGSLGEPPHALGYAAEPSPQAPARSPVMTAVKAVPAAVAALVKRVRPLTPHDKLYGKQDGPVRLASLTPPDSFRTTLRDTSDLPRAPYDKQTAVYVISDRKVYMPDGSALEAHSGLGDKMDDPRFVNVRMRGATPPHVYDLTPRESLFHGVEAIRMTPMRGEDAIFGRDGILAHTYMLGPNGQSNGCVSFKNYDAFLDAFKAGKINRMAVLARLD